MGYLTTFTVYNDGHDQIEPNSKRVAQIIVDACCSRETKSYGVGNHCNLIKAQKTRHADDATIYVHMGNTVCEMCDYAADTEEIMRRNPDFFKHMLRFMETNVKGLKRKLKEFEDEQKDKKDN